MGNIKMFNKKLKSDLAEVTTKYNEIYSLINSIQESVATIQFNSKGIIEDVNDNFLSVVGYEKSELVGKHHKVLCHDDYIRSAEYKIFWDELSRGKQQSGRFKRLTKPDQTIWLEASYFPITDKDNNVTAIFKIASDVTRSHNKMRDLEAASNALNRSMAIIEFTPDGQISFR